MVLDFPVAIAAAPLLSFVLSFFSILWLIKRKADWGLDHPNARSLHAVPVPRTGGLGLLSGVIAAWLCFSAAIPPIIWAGTVVLMVISLLDDIRHVPVRYRLLIHTLVASAFSAVFLLPAHGWLIALGAMAAVIWMCNLYNFMDGLS